MSMCPVWFYQFGCPRSAIGHDHEAIRVVVESSGGWGAAPITTRIYAGGICCPSEVPLILRMLEPLAGVTQARAPLNISQNHTLEPSHRPAQAAAHTQRM